MFNNINITEKSSSNSVKSGFGFIALLSLIVGAIVAITTGNLALAFGTVVITYLMLNVFIVGIIPILGVYLYWWIANWIMNGMIIYGVSREILYPVVLIGTGLSIIMTVLSITVIAWWIAGKMN